MSNKTFPIVFLSDGTFVECDSFPSLSCLAPDLACWDQSSNCWGAMLNTTNGLAFSIPAKYVSNPPGIASSHRDKTLKAIDPVLTPVQCTIDTCPLGTFNQAHFDYIPTLPGNALFAGIFAIILLIQLVLVVRYRTWS